MMRRVTKRKPQRTVAAAETSDSKSRAAAPSDYESRTPSPASSEPSTPASSGFEPGASAPSGSASIDADLHAALGSFSLDVAFSVPLHGITVLFGPSGCGKTSVLRCIAGLQRARGRLQVGDTIWQDDALGRFRKPHERPIGYVFQEASLFPHVSVRRNLLFGARRSADESAANGVRFQDIVAWLGIERLLDRAPAALSGGERQRVAIGRALLSQPKLLLMDEPLSALDVRTKEEILPYLESLHERLSIPMLYVTHDIAEADRLADTLLLLEQGRVLAAGPLSELEARADLPLLQAPAAAVTLQARVAEVDTAYSLTHFAVPGGRLVVPGRHGAVGSRRRLRIGAADVSFSRVRPVETTMLNCLPARIASISPETGDDARVHVIVALGENGAGVRIAGRVTRKSRDALHLAPGDTVFAQIKSVALAASGAGTRERFRT